MFDLGRKPEGFFWFLHFGKIGFPNHVVNDEFGIRPVGVSVWGGGGYVMMKRKSNSNDMFCSQG